MNNYLPSLWVEYQINYYCDFQYLCSQWQFYDNHNIPNTMYLIHNINTFFCVKLHSRDRLQFVLHLKHFIGQYQRDFDFALEVHLFIGCFA